MAAADNARFSRTDSASRSNGAQQIALCPAAVFKAIVRWCFTSCTVASIRISLPNLTYWPHITVSAPLNSARRVSCAGSSARSADPQIPENLRYASCWDRRQGRGLSDCRAEHARYVEPR